MVTGGSTAFVGRTRELEALERALDSSEAGSGATALVAGEAGIGKTRLASEVATRAGARGFEVLVGRSIDLVGTELPYQPFLEALRPLGRLPQTRSGGDRSPRRATAVRPARSLVAPHASTLASSRRGINV